MSHVLNIQMGASQTVVVDLRPRGPAGGAVIGAAYYHACKVKISVLTLLTTALIVPFILNDSDAAPSATPVTSPTTNLVTNVISLDGTLNPSVEWGQQFGKGYSPDVFKEQCATHLVITNNSTGGYVQIVVD